MAAFTEEEIRQALALDHADPTTAPVHHATLEYALAVNAHLKPGHQASMWLALLTNAAAWVATDAGPELATGGIVPLPMRETVAASGTCCRTAAAAPTGDCASEQL